MTYEQNTPQRNDTKAFTQPLIQANFQFLQTGLGTEHAFFPATSGSTMNHLQASMPNIAVEPTMPPAFSNGMYYISNNNARYITGGGTVCKLTEGVAGSNGHQWIGRVLFQWGRSNIITSSSFDITTILFPIPYTTVYNVTVGSQIVGVPNVPWSLGTNSISLDRFTVIANGSTTQTGCFWVAVGNA